jgi:CheY-like chemotaxis protein
MSNGLLIVDDNAGMRALIRKFVESSGFKVSAEACNGFEAIQRAKESRTRPDLAGPFHAALERRRSSHCSQTNYAPRPHHPVHDV